MSTKQAFSLVEMIVSILVLGIVFYALVAIFITANIKGVNLEVFSLGQSLAEGKLEEVMANSFAGLSDVAQTNFSGDLSAYSYQVVVDYVSNEALDVPVAFVTPYKKVSVIVRHPTLSSGVSLESIKADL